MLHKNLKLVGRFLNVPCKTISLLYVVMHSLFLPSCALEVWVLSRPWRPALGFSMLALVALTMALRYWAISTLGRRWNTRVVIVPGRELVSGGPYRWMRHPNYLAVVVEIAALPLVHGAWGTAIAFSLLNLLVLRVRLSVEEAALAPLRPGESA